MKLDLVLLASYAFSAYVALDESLWLGLLGLVCTVLVHILAVVKGWYPR